MNLQEIKGYTENFLQKEYGLDLVVPVRLNGRLKRAMGRFMWKQDGSPVAIEFSKVFLQHANKKTIKQVIKHEAIHYALFMKKLPFQDSDSYFQKELKKHESIASVNIKLPELQVTLGCPCGNKWIRRRALNNHRCGACKGDIKVLKREYV